MEKTQEGRHYNPQSTAFNGGQIQSKDLENFTLTLGQLGHVNGHDPDFHTFGYYGDGVTKGKVDSRLSNAQFTYLVNGHTFAAGLQQVSGDSDAVWLNQGDGSTAYFMTESMIGKFQRAGETTWQVRYGYDFARVGIPGLSFLGMYESGSNIRTPTGDKSEWERRYRWAVVRQHGRSSRSNSLIKPDQSPAGNKYQPWYQLRFPPRANHDPRLILRATQSLMDPLNH